MELEREILHINVKLWACLCILANKNGKVTIFIGISPVLGHFSYRKNYLSTMFAILLLAPKSDEIICISAYRDLKQMKSKIPFTGVHWEDTWKSSYPRNNCPPGDNLSYSGDMETRALPSSSYLTCLPIVTT